MENTTSQVSIYIKKYQNYVYANLRYEVLSIKVYLREKYLKKNIYKHEKNRGENHSAP